MASNSLLALPQQPLDLVPEPRVEQRVRLIQNNVADAPQVHVPLVRVLDEAPGGAHHQGLTLVHFSAQRKRFLWDRGCISGLSRGCLGAFRG